MMSMRTRFAILTCLLLAVTARGITPEVGKEKLRTLVKLPTVTFQSSWTFDAERGFDLGSGGLDARARIVALRGSLKEDVSDAEIFERIAELYANANDDRNSRLNWA